MMPVTTRMKARGWAANSLGTEVLFRKKNVYEEDGDALYFQPWDKRNHIGVKSRV